MDGKGSQSWQQGRKSQHASIYMRRPLRGDDINADTGRKDEQHGEPPDNSNWATERFRADEQKLVEIGSWLSYN